LYGILTIAIYRYNDQYRASLDADTGQVQVAGGTRFPLAKQVNMHNT